MKSIFATSKSVYYITANVPLCNKENIAKQIKHIHVSINDEAEIVKKNDKNASDDKDSGEYSE